MENTLAVKVEKQDVTISIEDVKKYICPKATDKELFMFMGISKSYGLNPFKREIHFVKYGDSPASIIVGYEQYLKRADRTGKLDGWNCWIEDTGKPTERAVIEIRRKDQSHPIKWEVFRKEFDKQQSTWKSMPTFMLKKVAIAQGFRLAFPDELGGMPYIPEELPQTTQNVTSEQLDKTEVVGAELTQPEQPPDAIDEKAIISDLKKRLTGMMKGMPKESMKDFYHWVIEDQETVDNLQAFIDGFETYRLQFLEAQGRG